MTNRLFCAVTSAALLSLILSSCGTRENNEPIPGGKSEQSSPPTLSVTPVHASPAFRGDLVQRVEATGLARAARVFPVYPAVSGRVAKAPLCEGLRVKKGAVLLCLEDEALQLAVEEARSEYRRASIQYGKLLGERQSSSVARNENERDRFLRVRQAEEKLQRIKEQVQKGQAEEERLLWARAQLEAAKMFADPNKDELLAYQSGLKQAWFQLLKAKYELEHAVVYAPFAGCIGDVRIKEGDMVSPSKPCCTLYDLSGVIVDVGVLETQVNALHLGRTAEVEFSAFPRRTFQGEVVAISPVIDRNTRTCKTEIRVGNPDGALRQGMFATARIQGEIYKNLFLVPREAVLERDNRKLVFIVRDGRAVWCYVETGRENEEYVEILSSKFDLKEGEPVITEGHFTLVHDAPVRIIE